MNSGHHQTSATDVVGYKEKLWEFMEWSLQDTKSPDNVTLFERLRM